MIGRAAKQAVADYERPKASWARMLLRHPCDSPKKIV